ncbi:MAG: hypothetical protein EAX91_18205 [Candidatus Lokiarchaeota archaeon]|nr:hypothetical protein [Candidatus Lokiarchaeota archaeon]
MDKTSIRFISFYSVPAILGLFLIILSIGDTSEVVYLFRYFAVFLVLFASTKGYIYFTHKSNKRKWFILRSLCLFLFLLSFPPCIFFFVLSIIFYFDFVSIFPAILLPILIGVLLTIAFTILAELFIGLEIDKKKIQIKKQLEKIHAGPIQYAKIKSIRIISTAQPLMINGRKIEKKDDSHLLNKVIYID